MFGLPMSKKQIMKGLNDQITGKWCCIVDFQLSPANCPNPEQVLMKLEADYLELISLRDKIEKLLV